jgi:lantibiotic modifying enzyme
LALDMLRRRGHAESRLDLAAIAKRTLEGWHETPDGDKPSPAAASLLCGESGLLLVAWRLAPTGELADRLLARVRSNVENDANEIMWGSPGTMLAAHAMLEWTGEQRWANAWQESAEELRRRRGPDGLWTQRLYGRVSRGLGPVHGAVGNVLALLQGGPDETLERETNELLVRTAVIEDGLANWLEGSPPRIQWCHGAPGIVTTAAPYLEEELLVAGAELTWRAGPCGPEKGSGLCHGTAGNGYALLKAFERTGDERWLERARRFAVHALGQLEQARARRGQGRYSLLTGDVGVALYAAGCLECRSEYPVMDSWDG